MSDINEELTTEHDIYISIGLKQPMKPSDCNKLIDSLLTENFNMSSWGTHTKNEWIEVLHELEGTIESQKEEIEGYKAITELAVKGFKDILVMYMLWIDSDLDCDQAATKMDTIAETTLSKIERLQNE